MLTDYRRFPQFSEYLTCFYRLNVRYHPDVPVLYPYCEKYHSKFATLL